MAGNVNLAARMYPHKKTTLAAAGTVVISAGVNVVRVTATAATTLTWTNAPNAPVVPIIAGEQYFCVKPGETLTAQGALDVLEMTG